MTAACFFKNSTKTIHSGGAYIEAGRSYHSVTEIENMSWYTRGCSFKGDDARLVTRGRKTRRAEFALIE